MFKRTNISEKRLYPMKQGPECIYDVGESSCRREDLPKGLIEEGIFVIRHLKRYFYRRAKHFLPFLP